MSASRASVKKNGILVGAGGIATIGVGGGCGLTRRARRRPLGIDEQGYART